MKPQISLTGTLRDQERTKEIINTIFSLYHPGFSMSLRHCIHGSRQSTLFPRWFTTCICKSQHSRANKFHQFQRNLQHKRCGNERGISSKKQMNKDIIISKAQAKSHKTPPQKIPIKASTRENISRPKLSIYQEQNPRFLRLYIQHVHTQYPAIELRGAKRATVYRKCLAF